MDPKTARRLALAIVFSAAAHAALLSSLQLSTIGGLASSSGVVQAWIEPAYSDVASGSDPSATDALSSGPTEPATDPMEAAPDPSTPPAREPLEGKQAIAQSERAQERQAGDIALPVPHDLTYYPVAALDSPPRPLGPADACYPEGAQGEVAYALLIDETGAVSEAALVTFQPDGIVTTAAVQGCRALKFVPAMKDGRAVRSRVRFVVGPTAP